MDNITKHRMRIGLYASKAASRSAEGRCFGFKQVKHSKNNQSYRFAIARLLLILTVNVFYDDIVSTEQCSSLTYSLKPVISNLSDSCQSNIWVNGPIDPNEGYVDRLYLEDNNKSIRVEFVSPNFACADYHGSRFYNNTIPYGSKKAKPCVPGDTGTYVIQVPILVMVNKERFFKNANSYFMFSEYRNGKLYLQYDENSCIKQICNFTITTLLAYYPEYHRINNKYPPGQHYDSMVYFKYADSLCPAFVQNMHGLAPASISLYRPSLPNNSPLHEEGTLKMVPDYVTALSSNENKILSRFILDIQSLTCHMAGNGTCCYLIGNKGTHCYNGNPGRTGEEEVRMHPDDGTLMKEGTHESVGCIRFMRIKDNNEIEYQSVGTGFRIGENYLMTAYHVLRENIENILGRITMHLENFKDKESFVENIAEKLGAEQVANENEQFTENISQILNYFSEKSGMRIQLMISRLEEIVDMEPVKKYLTQLWKRNYVVDFVVHKRFSIDWNIVFGNEESDIVILKLMETSLGQDFPRPFLLDGNFRQTDSVHIVRYIIREGEMQSIEIDPACFLYTDENELHRDIECAIGWWMENCTDKTENYFNDAYKECRLPHNEGIGLVIIRASESFIEGASGSPIVYLFNTDGQPVVSMIYQGGNPRFYYERENDTWVRQLNVPCKCFFERATTMKKLAELLSHHRATELRKSIFRQQEHSDQTSTALWKNFRKSSMEHNLFREVVKEEFWTLQEAIEVIYKRQQFQETQVQQTVQDAEKEDRPDIMLNTVNSWRQKTACLCTRSSSAAKKKLLSQDCLCIIGVQGAGKTTTIQQCALWLESEFLFTVYSITSPEDINKYYKRNKKQVFVIDDAFGIYSLSTKEIENWVKFNDKIHAVLGKDTKLLISVSSHFLNHQRIKCKRFVFCDKQSIIDIGDDQYKLTIDEMKAMLTYHLMEQGVQDPDDYINKIWTSPDSTACMQFSVFFPLLCNVYCSTELLQQDPYQFFINPFLALTKTFENIKVENKPQFCGLVLCALLDGRLTKDILKVYLYQPVNQRDEDVSRDYELLDTIMTRCKLQCPYDLEEVETAINAFVDIYVTCTENKYQMSNEVFRDIVMYLYNDPLFVFEYATSEFIRDRVRINAQHEHDCVTLVYTDRRNIQRLADRLLRDLKKDAKSGAEFIIENPNLDDSRLMSCLVCALQAAHENVFKLPWSFPFLRNKYPDRKQIVIDIKVINELFKQSMLAFYSKRDKLNYRPETWYNLVEVCLRRGVDCNMHIFGDCFNPLNISVRAGDIALTKLLLQYGADKRRLDWQGGDFILLWVCMNTKNNKLDLIKLFLEQEGDNSVVQVIASDKQAILQKLQSHSGDNLRLEEVSSDSSIKILAIGNKSIITCVERYAGKNKLQLVRQIHGHILTHSDESGRNILHYSVNDFQTTAYLLSLPHIHEATSQNDHEGRIPYWYVANNRYPDSDKSLELSEQVRKDMEKLYKDFYDSLYDF